MKRWVTPVIFAVAAVSLLIWLSTRPAESPRLISSVRQEAATGSTRATESENDMPKRDLSPPNAEVEDLNLANGLNAPGKTIQDDLQLLDGVFAVWQTNFLRTGNPVGTNAEITGALTGQNSLSVAFISPKNPAINRHGELCDRWGTPFFFHQLSGTRMEIISAGPDRKRGTSDDSALTP